MKMRWLCIGWLCCLSLASAEPSCEGLIQSFEQSFAEALQVITEIDFKQADREWAYNRSRLFKDSSGDWQSEVLERRGLRGQRDNQEGQGEFSFSCEGHQLSQQGDIVHLRLLEPNPDIPVEAYQLIFDLDQDRYLPVEVIANVQTRIMLVPVSGVFTTRFSEWFFP